MPGSYRGRRSRGQIVSLFLIGALVWIGIATVLPTRSAGEVTSFAAIGYVAYSRFEVDFSYAWSSTDCIEGRLYFDLAFVVSAGQYCGLATGEPFQGYVYSDIQAGQYSFQLYDATLGRNLYERNWTTPGVNVAFSISQNTLSVGESVDVTATMTMIPGGPDEYYTEGMITVDAGHPITQTVLPDVYGPGYWAYTGLTPVTQYTSFSITVPVSFTSTGAKTVNVTYWDPGFTKRGTVQANVAESGAVSNQNQGLGTAEILALIAFAVGVAGLAIALVSFLSVRRQRFRPGPPSGGFSPGFPQGQPPPSMPYQPPTGPPPPPPAPPG